MEVGLGCVRLGGGDGRSVADDIRLVRGAVDLGVTVFDTADVYGGGTSERVLGRSLHNHRDDVRIATKAGFVFRPRSPGEQWARRRVKDVLRRLPNRSAATELARGVGGATDYANQDFSPRFLRNQIHASLRRLHTDRIDVLQLHAPPAFMPGLIEHLVDIVAAGDVVQIGVGADSVDAAAGWLGVPGVAVVHVPFGVLAPGASTVLMPEARRNGQEVWVRGLLGAGLLTTEASDTPSSDLPRSRHLHRLDALAADAGISISDLALRYAAANAASFSTAIIGSTSIEHLAQNIEVLTGPPLASDLAAAVERIAADAMTGAGP